MSESDLSPRVGTAPAGEYPSSRPPLSREPEPSGSPSMRTAASEVASHAGEAGKEVASHAGEAGRDLAHAAQERAGDVAHEATQRARSLVDQARSEVTGQASTQQQRLAGTLRSIGTELRQMGDASSEPGYATDLVRQGADMAHRVAGWFEDREPGDVVREVQDFARRRPGVFLAMAATAGLLAGRLLRGVKDGDGQATGGRGGAAARAPQPSRPPQHAEGGTADVSGT